MAVSQFSELATVIPVDTTDDEKERALSIALPIAINLVRKENPNAAFGDGQFLAAIVELLKVLIPLILEILKS